MTKYEIVDFDGYVLWAMRDDGKYAVDPLYLDKFKEEFTDAVEVAV